MTTISASQPPARQHPPAWAVLFAMPLVLFSVLTMLAASLAGMGLIISVSATRDQVHRAALPPGGSVAVAATDAGVKIEAGPAGQVSVEDWVQVRSLTRALARQALSVYSESTITPTDGGVRIEVRGQRAPDPFETKVDHQVTIRMPAASGLKLSGGAGAADIHDLTGPIDVELGAGAVRLLNVTVTSVDRVFASAGAVDVENAAIEAGTLDISTGSGAIRVKLPRGTNATYDVSSANGAIFVKPETGSPIALSGSDRSTRGILGAGGTSVVRLRASSGAIDLEVG
ncbi:MAG TPA: DUF4097 family beta strand repeat-containing protein [Candidatus Dormibacteraeota bacterium]